MNEKGKNDGPVNPKESKERIGPSILESNGYGYVQFVSSPEGKDKYSRAKENKKRAPSEQHSLRERGLRENWRKRAAGVETASEGTHREESEWFGEIIEEKLLIKEGSLLI